MSQVLTAIYQGGVLHPETPLQLKEHQRVSIRIVPDSPRENVDQVLNWLTSTGKLTPPSRQAREAPVTEAQRIQLSRKLGEVVETPLSEVILIERGER